MSWDTMPATVVLFLCAVVSAQHARRPHDYSDRAVHYY
uniref:Uncharacterized protein n=1 Tax=Arundo donax TaxID=35708 RepID=A0A0A9HES6_ARUDO